MPAIKKPKILPIKQEFEYDCGPTVLLALLNYYGIKAAKKSIIKIAGTDKNGTRPQGMEKALKKFGFIFKSGRLSMTDLKKALDRELPIIILYQYSKKVGSKWKDIWDEGHYSILTSQNLSSFSVIDPYKGRVKKLDEKDFKERWHDLAGGKKYHHYGIIIFGLKNL
jgi:ABC-type bacteriocin/lantibiotic exporter with double-glycine peptidase domain